MAFKKPSKEDMMGKPETLMMTNTDMARWIACDTYRRLHARESLEPVAGVQQTLRPRFSDTEQMLATGPHELFECSPTGDGSYRPHNSGWWIVTGILFFPALIVWIIVAMVNDHRNSVDQKEAWQAAQPHWHLVETGQVTVSTHGLYLETSTGVSPWDWEAFDSVTMQGESAVLLRGQSTTGSVSWILRSDWAELVFVLWAAAVHPTHPQYQANSFVTTEWVNKIHALGYTLPGETLVRLPRSVD